MTDFDVVFSENDSTFNAVLSENDGSFNATFDEVVNTETEDEIDE